MSTLSVENDPLGQVYFFITDHEYGNETTKLVRLPGSCVAAQTPCPEPETITPPFGFNFSLTPLIWSPDGKYAALAYRLIKMEILLTCFCSTRSGDLAAIGRVQFHRISHSVTGWEWLAFRVQDGEGGEDIYAVRRDGSDLIDLTASNKLPEKGRPYRLSGWLNDNVILRSGNPVDGGLVYLWHIVDGVTKPLFDTPWNKDDLVPSPDSSFLVYTDVSGQKTVLKLLTPDGRVIRDLVTFQGGSIYPILWSPDGTQIAFTEMDSEFANGQDVYLIGSDGRNLQQVYRSTVGSITTIAFSPDGLHC